MEAKEGQTWTPDSWKALPIKQQPEYEDKEALAKALAKVQKLPPIVHQMEIEKLKTYLAQACEGKMFLLQVRPIDSPGQIHFQFIYLDLDFIL